MAAEHEQVAGERILQPHDGARCRGGRDSGAARNSCATRDAKSVIGPDERRAIWLQTPAGIDWRCEDDAADVSEAVSSEDIDDYIQREYVYRFSSDWPLHGA